MDSHDCFMTQCYSYSQTKTCDDFGFGNFAHSGDGESVLQGDYAVFNTGNGEKLSYIQATGLALLGCSLVSFHFRCCPPPPSDADIICGSSLTSAVVSCSRLSVDSSRDSGSRDGGGPGGDGNAGTRWKCGRSAPSSTKWRTTSAAFSDQWCRRQMNMVDLGCKIRELHIH